MNTGSPEQTEIDRQVTVENRKKLNQNGNLLYWYEQLYRHQFSRITEVSKRRILEIGSGVSPLKRFYPNVLTSDLLNLDYLDFVFDCHDIDKFEEIPDGSLDVITLTNVLHHLSDPVDFLIKASVKLKDGGRVIATEPDFSVLSSLIYVKIHHESVDFDLEEPRLLGIDGPLSSANIALPYLIFKKRKAWAQPLNAYYKVPEKLPSFTSLSYMFTGGISRRIPIPRFLYRLIFALDALLAQAAPGVFQGFSPWSLFGCHMRVGKVVQYKFSEFPPDHRTFFQTDGLCFCRWEIS